MADEVTVSASLRFTKGKVHRDFPKILQADVAGNDSLWNTQSVGITEEALVLGDVTVGGYILVTNLDPTNFVEIRAATGESDLIQLLPGDVALFRLRASAPYVIADTGACIIEYLLIDL